LVKGSRDKEDEVLAFVGNGFRPVAIEDFGTADLSKARTWVGSTP
jgi:hypothetical protein